MHIALLHNPGSGSGRYSKDQLVELLRQAGYEPAYREMDGDFEDALDDPGELLVVAGGDGTVGRVARAVLRRAAAGQATVPLAALPLGTANNTARTCGWKTTPEEIIPAWPEAQVRSFDVGVAEGPWGQQFFLEAAGLGLFPEAMSHVSRLKGQREDRLEAPTDELVHDLDVMADALDEQRAEYFQFALDGEDLSGEYLMVEAMNAPAIGPRLSLDPEADPADGAFEVVVLTEAGRPLLTDYLDACAAANDRGGEPPPPPRLSTRRGQHLRIDWQGQSLHADSQVWASNSAADDKADPAQAPATVDVYLHSGALRFLTRASEEEDPESPRSQRAAGRAPAL